MYDTILHQIHILVLQGNYVFTDHALLEMERDRQIITAEDVESALLSGRIVERQWDIKWHEWKYVVSGATVAGRSMDVVVKVHEHIIIITLYLL